MNKLLVGIFSLLLVCTASFATAQEYDFNDHPRLYLTPERIERAYNQHYLPDSYEWGKLNDLANRSNWEGAKGNALIYAVTGDTTHAELALQKTFDYMIENELKVNFNSNGHLFNSFACIYDWIYNYPGFTDSLKAEYRDWVCAVPKFKDPDNPTIGFWNWYDIYNWEDEYGVPRRHGSPYFNGAVKALWGAPVWGLAIGGEDPRWEDYVETGMEDRWKWVRMSLGYAGPEHDNLATWKSGLPPSGRDYGAGTMKNVALYADAMRTAVNYDAASEIPHFKNYLKAFIYDYVWVDEHSKYHFWRNPHGFNAQKGDGYFPSEAVTAYILSDWYPEDINGKYVRWFLNNQPTAELQPSRDYRYSSHWGVIFKDKESSVEPITESNLPLSYYGDWVGLMLSRSEWTPAGVEPRMWTSFQAGNSIWFNQNCADQGTHYLYAFGDILLTHAGLYDGGGGITVLKHHHQAVAGNTIRVFDPEENKGWNNLDYQRTDFSFEGDPVLLNVGGQMFPWRETLETAELDGVNSFDVPYNRQLILHDTADMTRRYQDESYVYGLGDLTNAYANEGWLETYGESRLNKLDCRPKVDHVDREYVYLRDHDIVITFDRIDVYDGFDFPVTLNLNSIYEPEFTLSPDSVEVPGHISTFPNSTFNIIGNTGKATVDIWSNHEIEIKKIGGEGYEYWVDTHNFDPFPNSENIYGGQWRVEYSTKDTFDYYNYLTVVQANPKDSIADTVIKLSHESDSRASFKIGNVLVSFLDTYNQDSALVSLYYTVPGDYDCYIFDLLPNTAYNVAVDGKDIETVVSTEAGSIHYSISGKSLLLTTAEIEEASPIKSKALIALLVLVGFGIAGAIKNRENN
mgnify:CR=1 FL=1